MGLRTIGFYFFIKRIKIDSLFIFIISFMFMAILIPMFFVQNGTPWNTIQFFYYYLFFFSIFAGIVISWLNKRFAVIFLIFAVLGAWTTLQHYLPRMPQSLVSKNEIEALDFFS